MDGMNGLLDFAKTPEGQGLLAAVAGGLAGARRGTPVNNLGRGGLAGIAGYNNALQVQNTGELRDMQMTKLKADAAEVAGKRAALDRIAAGQQNDPNYKPSFADLAAIDAAGAVKGLTPGAVDFSLEPKVGLNPETGKPAYFVQDKRGGTKWLEANVPPNYQLVPGTDYKLPQVFDKRSGVLDSPPGSAAPQPTPQAPAGTMPTQVDTNAPWANLQSPKEQDQMRGRVYEQDNKRLDDLRSKVQRGRDIMRDLERFGELNRQQGTGGIFNSIPSPTLDSQKKEMESITARLAPNQRPAGSGSSSDRDVDLFLKGLPGIDKPGDVNKAIRDAYAKQLADGESALNFNEKYLVDHGYLSGAEDARKAALTNEKSGGLDVSKLTRDQRAYLQQQDPEAYQRGIDRLNKNSGSGPKQAASQAFDSLPKAVTLKGKTIRDTQTGKLLRSNGMTWVEVK
jgi:hypothetical protein